MVVENAPLRLAHEIVAEARLMGASPPDQPLLVLAREIVRLNVCVDDLTDSLDAERAACAAVVAEAAAKVRGTSNWWGALLDNLAERIRSRKSVSG